MMVFVTSSTRLSTAGRPGFHEEDKAGGGLARAGEVTLRLNKSRFVPKQ